MACSPIQCHAFEVYPESNDIDFVIKLLTSMNVPCTYILHDKDLDLQGKLKKSHYHIMTGFPLNSKQRANITKATGIAYFLQVRDKASMYAYLTHSRDKDKEEGKHQYDSSDLKANNVFFDWDDFKNYVEAPNEWFLLQQIYQIIDDNDIIFFKDLVSWCSHNNMELFKVIHQHTYTIQGYMRSCEYKSRKEGNITNGNY